MITIKQLADKLIKEKSVAVFCHVRPDGDSIGSALAFARILRCKGIKADVYSSDEIPARFNFLNDVKSIKNSLNENYTALVAIDCAELTRLGDFAEQFDKHPNTYSIDHHISNTRYAKVNYVVDNAANAENVYEIAKEMGATIDSETANEIALGLITDTGNFKHKNVTFNTLLTASEMLKGGADFNQISYNMFSLQTKARAKLFGKVMSKIRYFYNDKIAVATVFSEDLEETGAKRDETEGFIDFLTGIEGVEVSACVLEMDKNKYKVSLRSKKTDVCAVASTFGGGGHILASGCQILGEYEEVIDKLTFAISRYIED